jgi:hypothetical protein
MVAPTEPLDVLGHGVIGTADDADPPLGFEYRLYEAPGSTGNEVGRFDDNECAAAIAILLLVGSE